MFEAITRLFNKPEALDSRDPKLSVAALMVHLAAVDGQMSDAERGTIKEALMVRYVLDEGAVEQLIKAAAFRDADAVCLYRFTSSLSSLEMADRLEIVQMMW